MDIATQIANILKANPDGLKASEIAAQIGCTRKSVNSYLYSHQDMYEQHNGYIWTCKRVQKNNRPHSMPIPSSAKQISSTNSLDVSVQQSIGGNVVSTLTITPNSQGYSINSTNNQIVCCDCGKFFSIHALACPFCGCPIHFVADTYYKRYHASAIKRLQQQERGQQRYQQQQLQREQEKKKDNLISTILRDSNYYIGNDIDKAVVSVEKLEQIHRDVLSRRELIASIPKSAETFFANSGVGLEILSTQTLEVITKRCSNFLNKEHREDNNLENQIDVEFRKSVAELINCDEQSMIRIRCLYTKYAREYNGNKNEYNIAITDADGTVHQLDVTFFGKLRSYFRKKTSELYDQAYETWLKPTSYMDSRGRLIDPSKGLLFVIYSNLANIRISMRYTKEIAAHKGKMLSAEDATEILSDIDVNKSLLYRAVAISQDDTIVESEKLNHDHSFESVFLLIGIYNDTDHLEIKRIMGIYCKTCNRYYIKRSDFLKLVMTGRVNARMLTAELSEYDYEDDSIFSSFSPESLLRKCGYTVNANDNLSDEKRHRIIKSVIDNRLYTPYGIISHLSFLVSMSKKVETRDMSYAIKKWTSDIDYIKANYAR